MNLSCSHRRWKHLSSLLDFSDFYDTAHAIEFQKLPQPNFVAEPSRLSTVENGNGAYQFVARSRLNEISCVVCVRYNYVCAGDVCDG